MTEWLWGKKSRGIYLLLAAAILLFGMLGSRDIWTQEHRWADIVSGMFYRHDFLHPYLNSANYYDKPLLSYWVIAIFSFITGEISTWTLRLPSALAGLLSVWSIYRLGTRLKDKNLGLLAGWLLLTCFYFIFWARTSSADMLNMAGILFAVYWYFEKKDCPSFLNYTVFFSLLSVTSLCKGLVGIVVPLLVIFPDLIMKNEWKRHLRLSIFAALIPAAIIYLLPFWASAHFGGEAYQQNGLYLVYRENILRYFQPFDHKGPIYTYFIFLPVYLLPWAIFFIPAVFSIKSRWKNMSTNSKWIVWSVLILFLFFTVSGSRRNYYVLSILPFAVLMTADWIASLGQRVSLWAGRVAIVFFILFCINFIVVQPLYYARGGSSVFAKEVKEQASKNKPWSEWQFVMLDPESKIRFYLQLAPYVKNYGVADGRTNQNEKSLLKAWPILEKRDPNIIFITRKTYAPYLKELLPNYEVIEAKPTLGESLLKINNENAPLAFIPISHQDDKRIKS